MTQLKITVGGAFEGDTSKRFIDAWHRAAVGEIFEERHLAFESCDTVARVLRTKRMALLRQVRRHLEPLAFPDQRATSGATP